IRPPRLRQQVRAALRRRKMSYAALAAVIGISRLTAARVLSPSGPSPGSKTRAAICGWLENQNGHNGEPIAEEPALAAGQVSQDQRDRLAGMLELDPRSLPRIMRDLAERAVVGQPLDAPDVQRIAAFLAEANTPAAAKTS